MKSFFRASLKVRVFLLLVAFNILIVTRPWSSRRLRLFVLTALFGIAFATTDMALLKDLIYVLFV